MPSKAKQPASNKQGYWLVYGVQDDVLIVMVMAVDKGRVRKRIEELG